MSTVGAFNEISEAEQAERLAGLARVALEEWGLADAKIGLIKYRENAVFSVAGGKGERYAMRVHRPGYRTDAHILSEFQWMSALAAVGVLTPEAVPTRDGELVSTHAFDGVPEPRQCDLLHWIDGAPIGSIEDGVDGGQVDVGQNDLPHTYEILGRLAATVHEHGAAWTRPEGFSRPAFDTGALVGEAPVWGKFWELDCLTDDQLSILTEARDKARASLDRLGRSSDRYGLIHGDFLPENVFVSGGRPRLLDFDDCGESWYAFELATSVYFLRYQPDYDAVYRAYVEGYRAVRQLPDEQLAMMPTFLMARGLSYLGWPAGRPEIGSVREMLPFLVEDTTALARQYLEES